MKDKCDTQPVKILAKVAN